jgi:hypothetical protein
MARHKINIDLAYTQRKVWVTKLTLDRIFVEPDNKRFIRQSQVNNLVRALENQSGFPSLAVNKAGINEKYRVINGNHRIEALRSYFENHPDNKVQVALEVYSGLGEQQEKDTYNIYAKAVKQTCDDLVKQNEEQISIYDDIKRRFPLPITTYKTAGAMKFSTLIFAYLAAKRTRFPGGMRLAASDFLKKATELTRTNYQELVEVMNMWLEAFVSVRNNQYATVTPLGVVMRIWFDNKDQISRQKFVRLLKTKVANAYQPPKLMSSSGAGAGMLMWNTFVDEMNSGRERDLIAKIQAEEPEETEQEAEPEEAEA